MGRSRRVTLNEHALEEASGNGSIQNEGSPTMGYRTAWEKLTKEEWWVCVWGANEVERKAQGGLSMGLNKLSPGRYLRDALLLQGYWFFPCLFFYDGFPCCPDFIKLGEKYNGDFRSPT